MQDATIRPTELQKCPACGKIAMDAEYVDVAVGWVQAEAYHCLDCGYIEGTDQVMERGCYYCKTLFEDVHGDFPTIKIAISLGPERPSVERWAHPGCLDQERQDHCPVG